MQMQQQEYEQGGEACTCKTGDWVTEKNEHTGQSPALYRGLLMQQQNMNKARKPALTNRCFDAATTEKINKAMAAGNWFEIAPVSRSYKGMLHLQTGTGAALTTDIQTATDCWANWVVMKPRVTQTPGTHVQQ
jgi:hypothetical protein